MFGWFYLIVIAMALTMVVLLHYLKRNDAPDEETGEPEEKELSLKDQMLMGISVPKQERPETKAEEENREKSFWEKVYSGKGPQPKYMRHIADRERKRAVEAAKLAKEKELEENGHKNPQ
ncbi:MAG: hypothetical protein ACLRWH_01325 [Emergencia sp.]